MANSQIKLNVNTKELDRLAIGARLYDMLDASNINNKLSKGLTVSEETIQEMINLVNRSYISMANKREYELYIEVDKENMSKYNRILAVVKSHINVRINRSELYSYDVVDRVVIRAKTSNKEELERIQNEIRWYAPDILANINEVKQ